LGYKARDMSVSTTSASTTSTLLRSPKVTAVVSSDFIEIAKLIKKQVSGATLSREDVISVRGDLLDWLIVVCKKLQVSNNCYFIAVQILDDVLEKNENQITPEEVHLLSIGCLVLASKYEEVKYVGLDFAIKSICHSKYTKEELRNAELFILQKLKFRLRPSHFEEFSQKLVSLVIKDSSKCEKYHKACIFLYKLILQNYQIYKLSIDNKLTLFFSILFFVLNGGMKNQELRASFQSFKFFEIADKFKVKMKAIQSMSDSIKGLYDKFIETKGEGKYVCMLEYSSLF